MRMLYLSYFSKIKCTSRPGLERRCLHLDLTQSAKSLDSPPSF